MLDIEKALALDVDNIEISLFIMEVCKSLEKNIKSLEEKSQEYVVENLKEHEAITEETPFESKNFTVKYTKPKEKTVADIEAEILKLLDEKDNIESGEYITKSKPSIRFVANKEIKEKAQIKAREILKSFDTNIKKITI